MEANQKFMGFSSNQIISITVAAFAFFWLNNQLEQNKGIDPVDSNVSISISLMQQSLTSVQQDLKEIKENQKNAITEEDLFFLNRELEEFKSEVSKINETRYSINDHKAFLQTYKYDQSRQWDHINDLDERLTRLSQTKHQD